MNTANLLVLSWFSHLSIWLWQYNSAYCVWLPPSCHQPPESWPPPSTHLVSIKFGNMQGLRGMWKQNVWATRSKKARTRIDGGLSHERNVDMMLPAQTKGQQPLHMLLFFPEASALLTTTQSHWKSQFAARSTPNRGIPTSRDWCFVCGKRLPLWLKTSHDSYVNSSSSDNLTVMRGTVFLITFGIRISTQSDLFHLRICSSTSFWRTYKSRALVVMNIPTFWLLQSDLSRLYLSSPFFLIIVLKSEREKNKTRSAKSFEIQSNHYRESTH